MKLTVAQRRMVIEYYAQQLVEEWPAVMTGIEIEKRLYEAALMMEHRINKFINKNSFNGLIEYMLDQQTFDRDPDGWLYENGYLNTSETRWYWKNHHEDMISTYINDIAGI